MEKPSIKNERILTAREVSEFLNVSLQTLKRWDDRGLLKSFRPTKKHHRRYKQKNIERFLNRFPEQERFFVGREL